MTSKLDKAIARARGGSKEETAMTVAEDANVVNVENLQGGEIAGYMGHVSTGDIARRLAKGAKAPVRILQSEDIKEGQAFAAIVEKYEMVKLPSKKEKGKEDDVMAWTFTMLRPHPEPLTEGGQTFNRWIRGARVSIVGGFQMDRQCKELVGKCATICRGGTIETRGGNEMNEWFCPEMPVRNMEDKILVESLSNEDE